MSTKSKPELIQETLASLDQENLQQSIEKLIPVINKEDETSIDLFCRCIFKVIPNRSTKLPIFASLLTGLQVTGFSKIFTTEFQNYMIEPNQLEICTFLFHLIEKGFYTPMEGLDLLFNCFQHSEMLDNLTMIQLLYATFYTGKLFKPLGSPKFDTIIYELKIRADNIGIGVNLDENSDLYTFLYSSFNSIANNNFVIPETFPYSKLISSLENDDPTSLKILLNSQISPSDTLEPSLLIPTSFLSFSPPLICCAAFYGAEKCVKLLIESGAPINGTDDEGKTLAAFAAMNSSSNSIDLLNFLKSSGVPFSGQGAMAASIQTFNDLNFEWILKEIKKPEDSDCVHASAQVNNILALQKLIALNAKLENRDDYYWTPLHVASANNSIEAVEILINQNVNINISDLDQETPLHCAAKEGNVGVVKTLLKSSLINVNVPDKEYATPLHWACLYGKEKVVKILLENPKINVNAVDCFNRTPAFCAASCGSVEALQILGSNEKVNWNIADNDGNSPLIIAAKNKKWNAVSFLVTLKSVNINAKNLDKISTIEFVEAAGETDLLENLKKLPGIILSSQKN